MNGSFSPRDAGPGFGRGDGHGFGFGRGPRGGRGFGPGRYSAGMFDAMDQLRRSFEERAGGRRMARGDVRAAVLALLLDEPMHGYQIIHEIEERSGGAWRPSAGSVYPTLQLLADEGLIEASVSDGRKTYALTAEGRERAEAAADKPAPWEAAAGRDAPLAGLPKAGVSLAQATAQVAHTGTPEQLADAVAVLDEARRKLYAILARE